MAFEHTLLVDEPETPRIAGFWADLLHTGLQLQEYTMLTTSRLESLRSVISSLEHHRTHCSMTIESYRLSGLLLDALLKDLAEAEAELDDLEDAECNRLMGEIEELIQIVHGRAKQ